jgi:hypothetical protein
MGLERPASGLIRIGGPPRVPLIQRQGAPQVDTQAQFEALSREARPPPPDSPTAPRPHRQRGGVTLLGGAGDEEEEEEAWAPLRCSTLYNPFLRCFTTLSRAWLRPRGGDRSCVRRSGRPARRARQPRACWPPRARRSRLELLYTRGARGGGCKATQRLIAVVEEGGSRPGMPPAPRGSTATSLDFISRWAAPARVKPLEPRRAAPAAGPGRDRPRAGGVKRLLALRAPPQEKPRAPRF